MPIEAMRSVLSVVLPLVTTGIATAFAPSRSRENCFQQRASTPLQESADASLSTIQNNLFLPILSDGLRRTSIATNKATSDEVFASSPSLQRLRQQVQKLTKVDTSSLGENAGLGLFATKNIKQGTIVGLYPAHALGYEMVATTTNDNDEEMQTDLSMFIAATDDDEVHFQANPHGNSPYLHATDQPLFQRQSLLSSLFDESKDEMAPPLYLDVNPNRNDELDSIWTSHFINDGASLLQSKMNAESIEEYYIQSTRAKNCVHIPFGPSPILATITTSKVKKGEELFTTYGAVYWLACVEDPGDDSNAALMTETIQNQIVESARDLQRAMSSASTGYSNEIADMETAFNNL